MADVLFTNVRVFDGGGEAPFTGDVLVQGNKISRVVKTGYGQRSSADRRCAGDRRRRRVPDAGHGRGAHAFLVERPAEPRCHPAHAAGGAHPVVRGGGEEATSTWAGPVCVGAAAAKPRLDVVIRNAINDGTIIGPRYLAASQEITVPGGLGDTTQPHLPQPEFAFGAIVSGPHEMRRCVRMFAKYGVDTLKINLSGESITGMPSEASQFTEEEIAVLRRGGQGLGQTRRRARALDAGRSSSASSRASR